jgi:hypothetical protein
MKVTACERSLGVRVGREMGRTGDRQRCAERAEQRPERIGTKHAAMRRREEMETLARGSEDERQDGKSGTVSEWGRAKEKRESWIRGHWVQMREYTTKYALAARTSPIEARRTFSSSTAKNCRRGRDQCQRVASLFPQATRLGRGAHIVRTADVTRIVTLTERPFVRNHSHQSEPSRVRPVEQRNAGQ